MKNKLPLVLELNNIDVLGSRFNGYDLLKYFKNHRDGFNIEMLVNNRLSYTSKAKPLFRSGYTEEYDWIVQSAEKKYLSTKNQLSLAEAALKDNPIYQKADLLHFHLYHNMNLPIEFLTRIPSSKKIIIDIHDTFWLTDKNIPMLEVFKYTNTNINSLSKQRQRVLNSIDAHFVVHSPYILNLFKKSQTTKNLKNIHFINFGIDNSIFKPLPKSKIQQLKNHLKIPKNNIVLLCRAQDEFKGTEYIIEALKLLKSSRPITIISVVNKGMLKELEDRYQIIDFGTVYQEQKMAELFNICDIFLSPSTEESFGFMAAEAMACGKPVIVFNGTALPDTTHAPNIGLAVNRDSKSLKHAIEHLINNPEERKKRGQLGQKFVNQEYNQQNYFKEYAKLFRNILKTSRNPKTTKTTKNNSNDIEKLNDSLSYAKKELLKQKTLSLRQYKIPAIDYNNSEIQDIIFAFNNDIYNIIKNNYKSRHLLYNFKRKIPEPIKKPLHVTCNIIIKPLRITKRILRRKNGR